MDAALEKRQVKRAYKLYAPAYDFIFDWIFNPGREAAIQLLGIRRGQQVLEVGALHLQANDVDFNAKRVNIEEISTTQLRATQREPRTTALSTVRPSR